MDNKIQKDLVLSMVTEMMSNKKSIVLFKNLAVKKKKL